jgi:hypothetical protein
MKTTESAAEEATATLSATSEEGTEKPKATLTATAKATSKI